MKLDDSSAVRDWLLKELDHHLKGQKEMQERAVHNVSFKPAAAFEAGAAHAFARTLHQLELGDVEMIRALAAAHLDDEAADQLLRQAPQAETAGESD